MKLIFLDTETTGNDLEKDRLCQICYKIGDEMIMSNFKPTLPISVKAMSVTNVTNKMVENCELFKGSRLCNELGELLKENILVAHNAKFDIAMLRSEGLSVPNHICTLRVARHLDDKQEIPEYGLQFLRYYYEVEADVNAHSADGDVIVLEAVFSHLSNSLKEKMGVDNGDEIIKKMMEISANPVLIRKFNFGKYNGSFLQDVVKNDRGYLEWLLKQKEQTGEDEDWIYTLRYYLK